MTIADESSVAPAQDAHLEVGDKLGIRNLFFPKFGRCGFRTAPGIGKDYPIEFLIFMRDDMSMEMAYLRECHTMYNPSCDLKIKGVIFSAFLGAFS